MVPEVPKGLATRSQRQACGAGQSRSQEQEHGRRSWAICVVDLEDHGTAPHRHRHTIRHSAVSLGSVGNTRHSSLATAARVLGSSRHSHSTTFEVLLIACPASSWRCLGAERLLPQLEVRVLFATWNRTRQRLVVRERCEAVSCTYSMTGKAKQGFG